MVEASQRHKGEHRCPVCGGRDEDPRGLGKRCSGYTSTDGQWVYCSREDRAGALEPNEHGLYVHMQSAKTPCWCGRDHEAAATPRQPPTPVRAHAYRDEDGAVLYEVLKMADGTYRQRRPLGGGQWEWSLGKTRRVLYRLPELLAADSDEPVYVTEGERDADTLASLGFVATCNPGGAGKWGMIARHAGEVLTGRHVVVVSDRDEARSGFVGQKHAQSVVKALEPHVRSVRAIMPPTTKDATDHVAAGGTLATMVPLEVPAGTKGDDGADGEFLFPPTITTPKAPEKPAATVLKLVPRPASERVDVTITPDAHALEDEIAALLAKSPELFERGGELVHVILDDDKWHHRIRSAPHSYLVHCASKAARFMVEGEQGFKQVNPPEPRVRAAGERGSWPGSRKLDAISSSPIIRPDGTVVAEDGYDASTRTYVRLSKPFAAIPERPTHSDAVLAYKRLSDVFVDFPYEKPEYVSATIACVLTLLGRTMFTGSVPCWVFDATSPRSGKSLQLDLVSIIGLGSIASRTTFTKEDEELNKCLASYAFQGARLVPFDNVDCKFGGAALDKVLTADDMVDFRELGKSTVRTVPWRAVVIATGNNVIMKGDMLKRVLSPRLAPDCENPEQRTGFRHGNDAQIREWVKVNRSDLVMAGLTILSAYHLAGKPSVDIPSWGGFTAWTSAIAAPLVWLGAPSPLIARRGLEDDDDSRREGVSGLIEGLAQLMRDLSLEEFKANHVNDAAFPAPRHDEGPDLYGPLREALCSLRPKINPATRNNANEIGLALRAVKGQIVNGKRLVNRVDKAGTALWRVETRKRK